jgi:hypothetical protein
MAIDKTIKSNRLLQSRRYTQAALTDAQEAFTSVLDINSKEIYAQVNLLPTASLPFSGSSQSGSIYATGGQNLLKYWYQHTLTPSNVVSASLVDAWFFIDPSGSSITPQIIQSGQQTNFISNKYADPSLTNADAQDNPPGYNVVVLVDNVKQNSANYQFDYKDGVLQFNASAPTPSQVVKVTAYQYIGQTLDTVLSNFSASIANISGSGGSSLSGNMIATGSITASVSLNSPIAFNITSASISLLSISTASMVTVTDLTVSNNLIVAGTASFTNVDNLTVKDKFILINSGSSVLADSGLITQYNAAGSGSAFYLEAGTAGDTGTYGRFAVAYDVIGTAQALTVDEFVVTAKKASGVPPATPTWGGTTNGFGNMYVNSDNGEIYIYS